MATEKLLIDANVLKSKLQEHRDFFVNRWGGFNKMPFATKSRVDEIDNCIAEIVNAPTVDAVEVVRCKDCRWAREKDYREPTDTPRELICQCFKHHYIPAPWGARMAVSHDNFCSYGERRESE